MKTVRDACQLQPNALSVKLSDPIEQLDKLISAEGNGTAFFDRTFITQGMKDLITEGIARLAGAANQCLVPQSIVKAQWDRLSGAERFYLKMIDMEARGAKTLDNYQNFAKAFKVRDFKPLLASHKANEARLKSAAEFARAEMGEGSELYQSTLRATLYALMELQKNVDGSEVLAHLTLNVPNYYGDMTQREWVAELAEYLAKRLDALRPDEASAARVLRELVKNQRLG